MNTAVINIKVDPSVKKKAHKVASDLGFTLSSLINAYLRQLIRNESVSFTSQTEEPSDYMVEGIKESEEDYKKGNVSPTFNNANDAIKWLNDSRRKYKNRV